MPKPSLILDIFASLFAGRVNQQNCFVSKDGKASKLVMAFDIPFGSIRHGGLWGIQQQLNIQSLEIEMGRAYMLSMSNVTWVRFEFQVIFGL